MINMCIASSYTCFFGNSCVSCQIYSNYVIPGVLHTQLSLLVIMVILLADPLLSTKRTPHKPAAGTIINMSLFNGRAERPSHELSSTEVEFGRRTEPPDHL